MENFKERLYDETMDVATFLEVLKSREEKLNAFINGDKFVGLEEYVQVLLKTQLAIMTEAEDDLERYLQILKQRLA